jgi:hypothetical protein
MRTGRTVAATVRNAITTARRIREGDIKTLLRT